MTVPCLLDAWLAHEAELLRYLRHHLRPPAEAEDLLHDLFLKAVRQRERFCAVSNPRAWLFEVARNVIIDNARRTRASAPLPDDLAAPEPGFAPVELLSACLPRVLSELAVEDREALELCDLGGMTQQAFAELKGLSLPGAKSRVQRARQRLRAQLLYACQVQLDEHGKVCCFVPRPPSGPAASLLPRSAAPPPSPASKSVLLPSPANAGEGLGVRVPGVALPFKLFMNQGLEKLLRSFAACPPAPSPRPSPARGEGANQPSNNVSCT